MKLTNFSRIENAVNIQLIKNSHIVAVGAGGAYSLYESLVRTGFGKMTIMDFDQVEESNIVRQGYETSQIGNNKVDALGEKLKKVNTGTDYRGITKNFLKMDQKELDSIFKDADIMLFLTDSFPAQSFGNILALKYKKPAIWAGFYERSQCAEIVFYIPGVTPACFRCAVSPRYDAQAKAPNEIKASSNCNTIFHSQLLDAFIGMLVLAILHNNTRGFEFSNWFSGYWDKNLIQFKVHPDYGMNAGTLFERTFKPTDGMTFTFNAIWQTIEPEHPPKYQPCPDCYNPKILAQSVNQDSKL